MTEDQQKAVKSETRLAIALNVVISAFFAWLVFPKTGEIAMWGASGMAFDLLPTTFMILFMTTLALSLVTRRRIKAGAIAPIDLEDAPNDFSGLAAKRLPRNIPLRAVTLAVGACVALIPFLVGALTLVGAASMNFPTFAAFKMAYGAFLGLVFTPIILLSAMAATAREVAGIAQTPSS